ncbi:MULTISPECIES: MBL fold metallo-hydrolase [unclassified Nocardiopsis]|uniref:MBL fold metallo-hydrolase n=1 Tax=unclassified Nocardiopsis TaxID=2649073 RepID=UPI00135813D5|nr:MULTISPECIES: MBL fold metallo-hydrolase [unclassified Nocardiopsis]
MKLTKNTHSCVRLERDGRSLVLDPGAFGDPAELAGAEAVLITHEHPDHFDEARLREALEVDPALQVWTLRAVAERISAAFPGRVHVVGHGDAFTAAGFEVRVHGEHHAVIHPDLPRVGNIGFLVEGSLFHPGDALTVPDAPVDTLLLPLVAPWSKTREVVDYVREVNPRRTIDVHDALLSPVGTTIFDRMVTNLTEPENTRLEVGDSTDA